MCFCPFFNIYIVLYFYTALILVFQLKLIYFFQLMAKATFFYFHNSRVLKFSLHTSFIFYFILAVLQSPKNDF